MGRKLTGKPVGRPKAEIDWTLFEQLCALQCTQSEMASMLKVHPETLSNSTIEHYGEDFSSVYKRFQESGKCSLRRNQFALSKSNTSMAIWLGKQWLGQRDYDDNKTKETQITLKIEKDGLGTGLNISAEALSAPTDKGSK